MPDLKKKNESDSDEESTTIDVGASFGPEDAKDEDFELDMDSSRFQGKKGQAGTRTKS